MYTPFETVPCERISPFFFFTSSIKGYSFANWVEDKELGIIDPVKEPLPKPDMK